jgi:hypothetical protein
MNKFVAALKLAETAFVLSLTFLAVCSDAFAQDFSNPPGKNASEENSLIVAISLDTGCPSSIFNQAYDRARGSSRATLDSSNPPRRRYKE